MKIGLRIRDLISKVTRESCRPATPDELHEIYLRRFSGRDELRFVQLWNELAIILNTPPLELDESAHIDALLNAAAKKTGDKPVGILNDILEFVVDNSYGEPEPDWTVGGVIEWLLDNGPPTTR
jgi:hypothetical protein